MKPVREPLPPGWSASKLCTSSSAMSRTPATPRSTGSFYSSKLPPVAEPLRPPGQEESISWLEPHGSGHDTEQPGPGQFTVRTDVGLCRHCSRPAERRWAFRYLNSCHQSTRSLFLFFQFVSRQQLHHRAVVPPTGGHQGGKISRGQKNLLATKRRFIHSSQTAFCLIFLRWRQIKRIPEKQKGK